MNLLIQILIYYIINFSFIIKSNCTQTRNTISCPDNNNYYNSIDCICDKCLSGKINENICYNPTPKSIYAKDDLGNGNVECNDGKLTELDGQGLWIGNLMCANLSIPSLDEEQKKKVSITSNDNFNFQFYMLSSPNKLDSGISTSIPITTRLVNNDEIEYYAYSCIYGFYEKSCNYLINLCALSMYTSSTYFCQKVNGDLTTKIKEAYNLK